MQMTGAQSVFKMLLLCVHQLACPEKCSLLILYYDYWKNVYNFSALIRCFGPIFTTPPFLVNRPMGALHGGNKSWKLPCIVQHSFWQILPCKKMKSIGLLAKLTTSRHISVVCFLPFTLHKSKLLLYLKKLLAENLHDLTKCCKNKKIHKVLVRHMCKICLVNSS